MKIILIFSLCCVALVQGDFLHDIDKSIEFNLRCAAVKVAEWTETSSSDQFKLKMLELQCNMGIDMDPDAFLFISYIVFGIFGLVVLMIMISILKCVCRTLTCSDSQKPTMVSIGHLPVRVIPMDDPHPYNRMV